MFDLTDEEFDELKKSGLPFHESLAMLMMPEYSEHGCAACYPYYEYAVPFFCEDHYGLWLENRERFERMFYKHAK